jgi:DNA-binding protein HU-beta
MNKQELIARIVRETKVSRRLASRMVAATIATISRSLRKGETVTLVGFGTFKTAVRKARKGRNPLTGGVIRIPRRKTVRFSAGKALKTAITNRP